MDLNALKITKLVACGIVGAGTGKIVKAIIKNNIQPEKLFDRVTVVAATSIISSVVARETKRHTDGLIDDIAKFVTNLVGTAEVVDDAVDTVKNMVPTHVATKAEPETVTTPTAQ